VFIGSMLSSTIPDRYIRPAIAFVIFASGLKYVGVDTTTLGWMLCLTLAAAGILWLWFAKPWERTPDAAELPEIEPVLDPDELVEAEA
jgi:hypothetical protein